MAIIFRDQKLTEHMRRRPKATPITRLRSMETATRIARLLVLGARQRCEWRCLCSKAAYVVRLGEKGVKRHEMPCNHILDAYLHIDCSGIDGSSLGSDSKGLLFPTALGRTRRLSSRPMTQADAYRIIARWTREAAIARRIGDHSFRAKGITEYLRKRRPPRNRTADGTL